MTLIMLDGTFVHVKHNARFADHHATAGHDLVVGKGHAISLVYLTHAIRQKDLRYLRASQLILPTPLHVVTHTPDPQTFTSRE